VPRETSIDPSLLSDHPFRLGRGRRFAAFDYGELRSGADAESRPNLTLELCREIRVLANEELRVLSTLAEADVALGEPGAGLLDELLLEA
jgi:hypothetical protein